MLYVYIYTYLIKLLSKIRFNPIQVTIWNLPQKSSQLPHEAPEKSVGLEVSGWWRPAQGRGTSQWDPSPSRRSWPLTAGGKLRWSEKHGKTMGKCGKTVGTMGKRSDKMETFVQQMAIFQRSKAFWDLTTSRTSSANRDDLPPWNRT